MNGMASIRTALIASALALGLMSSVGVAQATGAEHEAAHETGHGETASAHHKAPPINWFEFGYSDLDVYGEKLVPGSTTQHHMSPPLVLALMNFGVFFFILVWKAGPPIKTFVRTRHTSIKEALEEGQRLREEAEAKLAEYTKKIGGVEAEVAALIDEVRASAESEKQRIIGDAERQAEHMTKVAEQQIAAEIARARAVLKQEVMAAAVIATEAMLREKATAADHQKLIDGFLGDLATEREQQNGADA